MTTDSVLVRSKFVTSLGWLTFLLCGLLGLGAVVELIAASMLQNQPEAAVQIGLALQSQTGQFVDVQTLPGMLLRQAFVHGLMTLFGVPAAWGLLKRRNWARKLTIGLVVVATLGLAPPLLLGEIPASIPRALTAAVFVIACVLHGSIIKKLMSPAIVTEFRN
jgi:hypothetical protein